MNMKTMMITLAALAMSGTTHAITSEEIANALGVDPNIATFSLGGVSQWSIDTNTFHSGGSALKSGYINNSSSTWQSSDLVMTIDLKEACLLSYWYKRSCYNSSDYEKVLEVFDNTTYSNTGSVDWFNPQHVLLPGRHTVKFTYQRRYGYTPSGIICCAWIDEMSLIPILPTASKVEVTNIKCQQRYPWNGMVDIDYTIKSEDPKAEVWVYPIGYDKDSNTSMAPRSLTGDGVDVPVSNGTFRMTWKVTDDYPEFHSTAFTVKMIALTGSAPYMVVDLSGGVDALSYPVTYLSSVPEGGWGDEYKTTKLVLRLIPPGSFMMGSPSDENGRSSNEDLHGVVLTKPFYIGVFEVTQKQYQLVMGETPSSYSGGAGDVRPVENVSYTMIRGSVNGIAWPTHNQVDANSFMGRLRSKVNMLFDLPTEAQWEYACRAGTSTALNNGKNLGSVNGDPSMNVVGRYYYNSHSYNSGKIDSWGNGYDGDDWEHKKVGLYLPNVWGLYDMHGNVWEWCRDVRTDNLGNAGVIDPKGVSSSSNYRVYRGGAYENSASSCRSASRSWSNYGNRYSSVGFRVMCSPVAE